MEQLQDIPKIYTAIAEWMSCLVIILSYGGKEKLRKEPIRILLKLIGSFAVLVLIHQFCGRVSGVLWLVGMVIAVSTMVLLIKVTINNSIVTAIYLGCRAFLYAELVAALNWQVYYYYFIADDYSSSLSKHVFTSIVYAIAFGFFYKLENEIFPDELQRDKLTVTNRSLFAIIIVTALFFCISNLSYANVNTPFSTGNDELVIFNIRTLIDLAGFVILEAMFMQKLEDNRKNELDAIRNILFTQYAQYRTSQENIDLINRKYHDLKHQLQIIRNESNIEKKNEYIDEIEAGIRKYEAENKTGNPVLDTILTSKSNLCLKHDIQLVAIADGQLLNDIHVMDICTIFGNALDNAIEYELQIPDKEKRIIHLTVSKKNSFIIILVENYCEEKVLKEGEELTTTKGNKQYHGYGIKSIKYSIEKYEGFVNITNENNWFRVEMIIPT